MYAGEKSWFEYADPPTAAGRGSVVAGRNRRTTRRSACSPRAGSKAVAGLGRDLDRRPHRRDGSAECALAVAAAVRVGRVEQRDPAIDRTPDQTFIRPRSAGRSTAKVHASQSDPHPTARPGPAIRETRRHPSA